MTKGSIKYCKRYFQENNILSILFHTFTKFVMSRIIYTPVLMINGIAFACNNSIQTIFVLVHKVLHVSTGILAHSSFALVSRSLRLEGFLAITRIFNSLQRFSKGFKSGLWLGHSKTFILLYYPGTIS